MFALFRTCTSKLSLLVMTSSLRIDGHVSSDSHFEILLTGNRRVVCIAVLAEITSMHTLIKRTTEEAWRVKGS